MFLSSDPGLQLDRQGAAQIFAQHLLGALDFSSDPMEHNFSGVPLGRAASTFLVGCYSPIPPINVTWFNAVVEE